MLQSEKLYVFACAAGALHQIAVYVPRIKNEISEWEKTISTTNRLFSCWLLERMPSPALFQKVKNEKVTSNNNNNTQLIDTGVAKESK